HSTTSTSIPGGAAPWDEDIFSGNLFYSYVPTVAGTYSYECKYHASMGMVGGFVVNGSPTGIAENNPSVSLQVNSVIVNNELKITYSTLQPVQSNIQLLSMAGAQIKLLWQGVANAGNHT